LSVNNNKYYDSLEMVDSLKINYDHGYEKPSDFSALKLYDLNRIGYPIKLYFTTENIVQDFVLEQYAYRKSAGDIVEAEEGDTVLDIGGCWGDTALYFAAKVGRKGMVYSFEFIPRNINIHNLNVGINGNLKNQIKVQPMAVSNYSDVKVYYEDKGAGSKVSFKPIKNHSGTTTTITIDDFVERNNIQRVDFIKMDIEGAEMLALEGARKTLAKFRPKLAIAIYHSFDDFANIPNWILDLDLGYNIHIGHYTIHDEETICFAKTK